MLAGEGDGVPATGQAQPVGDLGNRADVEELVLMTRHEHDTLVIADLLGQRDPHVREHNRVLERDQPQDGLGLGGVRLGLGGTYLGSVRR